MPFFRRKKPRVTPQHAQFALDWYRYEEQALRGARDFPEDAEMYNAMAQEARNRAEEYDKGLTIDELKALAGQ